jgi:hypothetical protein
LFPIGWLIPSWFSISWLPCNMMSGEISILHHDCAKQAPMQFVMAAGESAIFSMKAAMRSHMHVHDEGGKSAIYYPHREYA